jgi:hypothetical protein
MLLRRTSSYLWTISSLFHPPLLQGGFFDEEIIVRPKVHYGRGRGLYFAHDDAGIVTAKAE